MTSRTPGAVEARASKARANGPERCELGNTDLDFQIFGQALVRSIGEGEESRTNLPGLEVEPTAPEVGSQSAVTGHVDGQYLSALAMRVQRQAGGYRGFSDAAFARNQRQATGGWSVVTGRAGSAAPGRPLRPSTTRRAIKEKSMKSVSAASIRRRRSSPATGGKLRSRTARPFPEIDRSTRQRQALPYGKP